MGIVQVTADVEAVADKPSAAQQKAPPAVVRARMSRVWRLYVLCLGATVLG